MKLLHDRAGVAGVLEVASLGRERRERKEGERERRERERKEGERRLAEFSLGYIVKRDEPPFPLGGRARSVATIFEIYRGRKVYGV